MKTAIVLLLIFGALLIAGVYALRRGAEKERKAAERKREEAIQAERARKFEKIRLQQNRKGGHLPYTPPVQQPRLTKKSMEGSRPSNGGRLSDDSIVTNPAYQAAFYTSTYSYSDDSSSRDYGSSSGSSYSSSYDSGSSYSGGSDSGSSYSGGSDF